MHNSAKICIFAAVIIKSDKLNSRPMDFKYDVIVVGAGHAGCEAAAAAANMGSKTLLITIDMNKIAQMSCNPAVGGIAKGQIVREIDALGGQMGIVTDLTAIQFRMLNKSKGAAMWSPRSQSDRKKFIEQWTKQLTSINNLFIWQDTVTSLIIKDKTVIGVHTALGVDIKAKAVVLTNGTFLNGLLHFGEVKQQGGRISEPASLNLTEQLRELGFETGRMKTGTPCRIDGRTIDFSSLTEQQGDNDFHKFSYLSSIHRKLKQRSCHITYTNERTHEILRQSLDRSPLYNGQIQSIGPRYCPSIETKIVTFADKNSHQLFLEPEGEDSVEYYLNGFSSSLPLDVQIKAIHTIAGLEHAELYRPGYAIEYDYFPPTQLHHSLETRIISNLYFAGQINGTTGYEEAAGQGLIAGINAHLRCNDTQPVILSRDEAYIGVLIDDLICKGVDEPYRMFTSRSEYRVLLRQDNADERLTPKSTLIGLADSNRQAQFEAKRNLVNAIIDTLNFSTISPQQINGYLESIGESPLKQSIKISELLARPAITMENLVSMLEQVKHIYESSNITLRDEAFESAEIEIKYKGYIQRQKQEADKLHRLERITIPNDFDFNPIQSLSTEARQKLTKHKPTTIGEASRIPGISPNDISVLLILMGR